MPRKVCANQLMQYLLYTSMVILISFSFKLAAHFSNYPAAVSAPVKEVSLDVHFKSFSSYIFTPI
jgi:hypothetical protein